MPDWQKLLHGILEITPPVRQGFPMPKRLAQITQKILFHSKAENTPRNAHPVQRFPIFCVRISVEEIIYGELKYNIIPIVHARACKLLHLKWACLMLGIYGEGVAPGDADSV